MKLYAFSTEHGQWYAGRTPTGRIKHVDNVTEATLFSEETVQDAEECKELGYSLYEMELSEPQLKEEGAGTDGRLPKPSNGPLHVYPMDLFGGK